MICVTANTWLHFIAFLLNMFLASYIYHGGIAGIRQRTLLFLFFADFALYSILMTCFLNPCTGAQSARILLYICTPCWVSTSVFAFLLAAGFNGKLSKKVDAVIVAAGAVYVAGLTILTMLGRVQGLEMLSYGWHTIDFGPEGVLYNVVDNFLVIGSGVLLAWQTIREKSGLLKKQGITVLVTAVMVIILIFIFRKFRVVGEFVITANVTILLVAAGVLVATKLYGFVELTPSFAASVIFNTTPEMMLLVEPDGIIALANSSFASKAEKTQDELQGTRLADYLEGGDGVLVRIMNPAGVTEVALKAGKMTYTCLANSSLLNKGASPAGVAVVLSDITELKKAQDELKKYRDRLEVLVEERTRALDKANRLLEHKARTAEEFTKASYHDLMEPVNGISRMLGYIKSKAWDKLNENAKFGLEDSMSYAKKMSGLIRDMRDYINIDYLAGSEGGDCSPDGVFIEVLAGFKGRVTPHFGAMPAVGCPRQQLAEIFRRLTDNSVKFNGGRVPEIWLSCAGTGSMLEFLFEDNGRGVEDEYLSKIFGVFEKLSSGPDNAGSGIGLAICRRVAELHGGSMTAERSVKGGLAIRFTLPSGEAAL